jgi:hypothetical protein
VTRGALVGCAIAGVAGAAWALWGASGLSGWARVVVSVLGVVVGLAVVVRALLLARRAPGDDGGSMFASRSYRLIVVAEVVALVAGNVVLGRTGLAAYVIAWTAFVVGVHFLAFGRAFDGVFTVIGGLLIVAALAGVVVGVAGAGASAVLVVTGLLSAVVLLSVGALRAREYSMRL